MYILTEWCAKVVMAYAMIKKGTRTCHAKQWPSPKSYCNHTRTALTLATSKTICSLNATCQHNPNHIVSNPLNCDHQFKFNPLYFIGIQNMYRYVYITICTYMKTLWCSNYDQ